MRVQIVGRMPTMAYVVLRPGGRYELRESTATSKGPRSRTLVGFRALTPEVVERAQARATRALSDEAIRVAARRAGAPVERSRAHRAAASLLRELDRGAGPPRSLTRLLARELDASEIGPPTEAQRAAGPWIAASPQERGEVLRDLLLLTDSLPVKTRTPPIQFPVIRTSKP